MTNPTSPTERVGRYQLLEPIGIGPSGAVSRAKVFGVAGFERQFAVKRFHAELTATAAMAAMMSAAARAYGSLEHPRIARMSEFGVAQGATFTAVEYVVGLDALRLISEARLAGVTLAAGGALALVSQAARAVGYAHGRGLTHLGLAPTNVIVTADGDIKITDFGILSATLPPRPLEVSRLSQRIPYLAPEQLANEATSAATDVFALGVLAYELVTGTRTFKGETPQQVASAIMAGPPAEPALPRPIVRVLQRCMARSPFERFPDARAMADALDAALRVAPVPGTRKDIGAQVKETLDRLVALNEGQMSGMVALHLGTGPIRRLDDDDLRRAAAADPRAATELRVAPGDAPAFELGRPEGAASGPTPFVAQVPPMTPTIPSALPPALPPMTTMPDLPRQPMTTVPGLAPPPIPVPHGVSGPTSSPLAGPAGNSTLLGMGKSPPAIPTIKPRAGTAGGSGASAKPPSVPAITGRPPGTPPRREGEIHTLDPSDVVALDAGIGEAVELDAIDDHDDHDDLGGDTVAATGGPPESRAPTRPIPPQTLEPLLTDPSNRRSSVAIATEAEHSQFDDHDSTTAESAAAAGLDADHADPDAGPDLGKTMLGFAAPTRTPPHGTSRPRAETSGTEPPISASLDAPLDALLDAPLESPIEAQLGVPLGMPSQPSTQMSNPWQPPGEPPDPETTTTRDASVPPHPEPAPPMPHGWVSAPPPMGPPIVVPSRTPAGRGRGAVLGLIGAAVLGIGAWQVYARVIAPAAPGPVVAKPPGDAAPAVADATKLAAVPADTGGAVLADATKLAIADAAPTPADAAKPATAPVDARPAPADATKLAAVPADATPPADAAKIAAVPADAARLATAPADAATPAGDAGTGKTVVIKPAPPNAGPADSLAIASTPPGARVFLDGADAGATPVKLAGSPDRHTVALLLAGHDLYLAQVDGHGTFQVPLKEVTPTNGPAGIKVLRCKDKNRYYVFVDGKPTGQTCPTERIGCEVGAHTVEVYDVVSETRHKWDIVVKDTRLSFRVRVE